MSRFMDALDAHQYATLGPEWDDTDEEAQDE